MRAVVIGASGNIGSAVLRELASGGDHEVLGVARRKPDVPQESALASVHWQAADVARDDLDGVVAGADVVVHLAWMFQPTRRPAVTWATNAIGSQRVLEAVGRQGVGAVVCASSIAAYSPVDHDEPVDEGWRTDGASGAAYAREKAYVERILDAFEALHPQVRIVRMRPAFVFQRSAASEQRRVFGGTLARPTFFDPRHIPLLPVPRGLRLQTVHAGDVARAFSAAVQRPVAGAFNLAADSILRREELGELLGARTFDVPVGAARAALAAAWRTRLAPVPPELFDALMRLPVMATDRAREELGWVPRHSAADALGAMFSGAYQRAGSTMPPLHP
jgi:nucleoside-diphosphate-sugar epimerase